MKASRHLSGILLCAYTLTLVSGNSYAAPRDENPDPGGTPGGVPGDLPPPPPPSPPSGYDFNNIRPEDLCSVLIPQSQQYLGYNYFWQLTSIPKLFEPTEWQAAYFEPLANPIGEWGATADAQQIGDTRSFLVTARAGTGFQGTAYLQCVDPVFLPSFLRVYSAPAVPLRDAGRVSVSGANGMGERTSSVSTRSVTRDPQTQRFIEIVYNATIIRDFPIGHVRHSQPAFESSVINENGPAGAFLIEEKNTIIPLIPKPPVALPNPDTKVEQKAPDDNTCTAKDCTGEPIDIFSGEFVVHNIDLMVPGILPPQVSREYHSLRASVDGPFGKGSGMIPYNAHLDVVKNAEGIVQVAPGTDLVFQRGDQTKVTLKDSLGTLLFSAPEKNGYVGITFKILTDSQGKMIGAEMNRPNGDQWLFDKDGYLSEMHDRHHNAVAISRDSEHRVIRLEDPSTHKGIDFTYDGNGHVTQAAGLSGQIISYAYDEQGRLTQITDPAGHSTVFSYMRIIE